MKSIRLFIVLLVLSFVSFAAGQAQAVEVIQNGSFDSGLDGWVVNPEIDSAWTPLSNGAVDLHPLTNGYEGYRGTVIYQNLNVTGISNVQVQLSMDMWKNYAPDGSAITVVLDYIDDQGQFQDEDIVTPLNQNISADPLNPTLVTASYTFPANAAKLVKIEIEKIGDGSLMADNISLSADGVTIGTLPLISGISAAEGAYGSTLTITGANFGATQDTGSVVSIGESSDGVLITSWSDTSITATINDPVRSGRVYVAAGYVESNIDFSFEVTSPNYTVDIKNDDLTVVKGQTAEYVIAADFHNEFSTTSGVTFSIVPESLPAGAVATFAPSSQLNKAGGILLKIDTSAVAPGDYSILLKAEEPNTQPRYVSLLMEVVTIQTVRFYDWVYDPQTQMSTTQDITQIDLTVQGSFTLNIEATDSLGNTWTTMAAFDTGIASPLTVSSSDPSVVYVQPTTWGPNYYALAAGNANIVVTASDGTQATLPVNVTIGETAPQVAVSLSPTAVHNNYTGDINFSATGNYALTMVSTSVSGMVNFNSNFSDNGSWYNSNMSYSSTFQLVDQEPAILTVLFSATTSDGITSATGYVPLQITADPAMGQIKGGVRILDDMFAEFLMLEFYNTSGTKVFERELYLYHEKDFHLVGIPAGDYRIRLVHEGYTGIRTTQWYPNAESIADAQLLTFTAGGTIENVYFFLTQGPSVSFSGKVVDSSSNPVGGATVEMAGNSSIYAATASDGSFTLSGLPIDTAFSLRIVNSGYADTYSPIIRSSVNIDSTSIPYVLFTPTEVSAWGIESGKTVITGRVWDMDLGSGIANAEVLCSSAMGQGYTVIYPGSATNATATEGKYMILNVADGDKVSVTAQNTEYAFDTRVFTTHADAVSEGWIFGTADSGVVDLRIAFDAAIAALKLEDITTFMTYVSVNYLDDGMNREAFQAELEEEFLDYDFQQETCTVLSTVINDTTAELVVLWNGVEREVIYLINESGQWKLYGNQKLFDISARSGYEAQSENPNPYWVSLDVEESTVAISSVTVTGDGIDSPISLYHDTIDNRWHSWGEGDLEPNLNPCWSAKPALPLTYTFTIYYGDGGSQSVTETVTVNSFVEVFPMNPSPAEGQTVTGELVFSWTPVPGYSHGVELNDASWNRLWEEHDLYDSTVTYDGDLLAGGSYVYNIVTRDEDENYSILQTSFNYTASTTIFANTKVYPVYRADQSPSEYLGFHTEIADAGYVRITAGPGLDTLVPIELQVNPLNSAAWTTTIPVTSISGGQIQTGTYTFEAIPAAGGDPVTTTFTLTGVSQTPDAVILVSPFEGTPDVTIEIGNSQPTFSWNTAAGAQAYRLRVDAQLPDSSWERIYTSGWLTGTSHQVSTSLPSNYSYRWYVDAYDGSDWGTTTASSRSVRQKFTVVSANITAHIIYMASADGYQLEFMVAGDLTGVTAVTVSGPNGVSDLPLTYEYPGYNAVYPSNPADLTTLEAGTYIFTLTGGSTPSISVPFDPGTAMIPQTTDDIFINVGTGELSWNSVTGAMRYYIIVKTSQGDEVYNGEDDTPITAGPIPLFDGMSQSGAPAGEYSVQVVAVDMNGNEAYSAPAFFTYEGGALPGISFTGKVVDSSSTPVAGAIVEMAGNSAFSTTTTTEGTFAFSGIPSDMTFSLQITKTGYVATYSAMISTSASINITAIPYVLFNPAEVSAWGVEAGKTVITGMVLDKTSGSGIENAVVSCTSMMGQSYTVIYPESATNATAAGGRYMIFNVANGDMVTVSAGKSAFAFDARVFMTHGDAVSEGTIFGTGDSNVLALRDAFDAAIAALNDGYITTFMTYVSESYLDDGMNKAAFQAELEEELLDPDFQLETCTVLSTVIDGTTAKLIVLWNGIEREVISLIYESGQWKLYGNQKLFDISARSGYQAQSYNTFPYWVSLDVEEPTVAVSSVTVTGSGIDPAISLYYDPVNNRWHSWSQDPQQQDLNPRWSTKPALPLTYNFTISYEDGGTQSVTETVTVNNFVEVFPSYTSPAEGETVTGELIFSWTPVPGYSHGVELNDAYWSRLWEQQDLLDSSVTYDGEPLAGGDYVYNIVTRNADDNYSILQVGFTYQSAADVPDLGQAILALQALTGMNPTGLTTMGDINNDGRIGLAEAIYVLETNAGLRIPLPPVQ